MPRNPKMPKDFPTPESGDSVRDGIQQYLNDHGHSDAMLVHYVVVAGVASPTEKGWETKPVLFYDRDQPDYVTDGLLATAPNLLDEEAMVEAMAEMESDDDEDTGT